MPLTKHNPKFFFSPSKKRLTEQPTYLSNAFLANTALILLFIVMIWGLSLYIIEFTSSLQNHPKIDLSFSCLPKYTFFSLCRGLIAYFFSLCFSITLGYIAAKDRLAEKILLPLLDIFQSIPVLGFMPGLFLLCIAFFPNSNIGLELASIIMIFTSQTWNMTFSVYHSLRTIPQEKKECATFYSFSSWQKFKWMELPCCAISLIWNSVMSMAGGWFFLMASEAFILKGHDYMLPGLGSYMRVASNRGDILAMTLAALSMIILIIFLDQLFWRPLITWSQKFRLENNTPSISTSSWFLHLLQKTSFSNLRILLPSFSFYKPKIYFVLKGMKFIFFSRLFLILLLFSLTIGIILIIHQISQLSVSLWLHLGHMTLLTFSRVILCLFISLVIALPIGMAIGLCKRASTFLEPILQIAASFPATLLFPALTWLLYICHINLNVGTVILMLTGTGWIKPAFFCKI